MFNRFNFNKPASPSKVFHTDSFHLIFFLDTWLPMHSVSLFPHTVILFILVFGAIVLSPARGWAWERNTHEELTEQAIQIMEANINNYLITNLGLEGGLNESLPGGTPRQLMIQGSNTEDNFPRFLNHFHEPIGNKGLELTGFGGISAIDWSLAAVGAQDGEDSFSWNDAREYYFKALTSETKDERDENWGKTFRALGQVMHLLQDSANPSHVRADTHLLLDGLHDYMARRSVGSYIGGGIFFAWVRPGGRGPFISAKGPKTISAQVGRIKSC